MTKTLRHFQADFATEEACQQYLVACVGRTVSFVRSPEGAVDLALMVDVYHEFSDPPAMLIAIRRIAGRRQAMKLFHGIPPGFP